MDTTSRSHPIRRIIDLRILTVIFFTYAIGVGIAYFLGTRLDWVSLIFGLLTVIFLVEMRNFLSAYYDHPDSLVSTFHRDDPFYGSYKAIKRHLLLQISLTVLTAASTTSLVLILHHGLSAAGFLLFGLVFLICYFSVSPPLRLEKKGYGELLESLLVTTLIPAIALSLQGEALSYFLIMLTLPLALIFLAMRIATSLQGYGYEITHDHYSLTARLGWQKAMSLHNLLIIAAFLLIGVFGLAGLSWTFIWPMLLGLPFGGFQIYLIQEIAEGAKPHWRLLRLVAVGFYFLMTYLVLVSLWI